MIFQLMGILILALFYGCYFVKALLQKKKGIRTDQLGRGKTGLTGVIEVMLKIVSVQSPVVEIISIVTGLTFLPFWARIAGTAAAVCGTAVFILSVFTMRDNWRAGVSEKEKTELVTGGIYRISRNPAFLGFDLVYIGIMLMFFNPALVVSSGLAMLMFHLQIVKVEEPFLESVFGAPYREYRRKVSRYLGRRF